MVRPERFELPTFWFVGRHISSIGPIFEILGPPLVLSFVPQSCTRVWSHTRTGHCVVLTDCFCRTVIAFHSNQIRRFLWTLVRVRRK